MSVEDSKKKKEDNDSEEYEYKGCAFIWLHFTERIKDMTMAINSKANGFCSLWTEKGRKRLYAKKIKNLE